MSCAAAPTGELRLLPIILILLCVAMLVLGIVLGNVFETYHTGSSL